MANFAYLSDSSWDRVVYMMAPSIEQIKTPIVGVRISMDKNYSNVKAYQKHFSLIVVFCQLLLIHPIFKVSR